MKHPVKNYSQHLDDMENWKGQQEDRRFRLVKLKQSYGPEPRFGGTEQAKAIDVNHNCALDCSKGSDP